MGDLFRRRDDWNPCLPAFARILHGCSRFLFLLVGHLQGDRRVIVLRLVPRGFFWTKGAMTVTMQELLASLTPLLPNLLLDEEADGEILIYSGFRETVDGVLEEIAESSRESVHAPD